MEASIRMKHCVAALAQGSRFCNLSFHCTFSALAVRTFHQGVVCTRAVQRVRVKIPRGQTSFKIAGRVALGFENI